VIVYEVSIEVREAMFAEYRAWLFAHAAQILELPGFLAAEIFERREPATADMRGLIVHYRLLDEAALQRYLDEHAPRLREDGVRRFGDAATASRRVLVPAAGWPHAATATRARRAADNDSAR
jgi:hypothetical protein